MYIVLTDTVDRFQSTSPVRGTTGSTGDGWGHRPISIHVPREGDDQRLSFVPARYFLFQSTSPVRGTTRKHAATSPHGSISIHVPREGDDSSLRILTALRS